MKTRCTSFKKNGLTGFRHHVSRSIFSTLLTVSVLILPACQRSEVYHGHFIKDCDIKALCVGKTTKTDVFKRFGTPTVILSYDPNTVYYLRHVVYTKPVLATQPVSCKCLALTFSKTGVLSDVFTSTQLYSVVLSKEKTPLPSGHQEGFFQQMVRSLEQSPPDTTFNPLG